MRFTALPTQGLTLQTQVQADQEPDAPYRVYAPHWSNESGLSTTIFIRNVQINRALTAKVSLTLNHRTVTLPQTRVDSLQTIAIDLAKELADRGERVEQSGGAIIDFEAQSAGAVNAHAQVLDTTKGISFTFPFMLDGSSAPGPLEAVAWYFGNNTDAFIALQNTTAIPTTAVLTMFVSGRAISLGQRQLKPHEVTTIKLPSPEGLGTKNGPRSVGVRVEHNGIPGAVVAQGWVVDERIGFSTPFTFHHKSNCNCSGDTQHLYSTGVQIGAAGAMMGLAPGTIFSPYLAARNNSDKPLAVRPVFSYAAGNRVEKATLPEIPLGPQESALVNLRDFQESGIIPLWVGEGNIDLQYNGEGGALIAELASVDQRGGFVSPVPLTCNGNKELHMTFWRTDGDWHSAVTIENIASVENIVEITISYPGGRYVVEKRIAAGETIMVSINELQQSGLIPSTAKVGGINIWSTNVVNGLVINAMLVNPVTRTCGECGAQGWVTRCALTDSSDINIISISEHLVGDDFSLFIRINWTSGLIEAVDTSCQGSSDTSVASCSAGLVVANAEGTATITGLSNGSYPTTETCSIFEQLQRSGIVRVKPPTLTGPASVTRGSSATFEIKDAGATAQISNWQFTDGTNTVSRSTGTANRTWTGVMVTSGTVSVRVVVSGRPYPLSKSITVNNRTGFAFTATAASKQSNGFDCGDGVVLSLPSPPTQSGDAVGKFCLRQKFSFNAAEIGDGGPNQGFKYVTSVSNSADGVSTGYFYVISPDLENTASDFYRAQCGNYNAQTNPNGFISGATLLANTTRHESGSVESHYNNYVVAQDNSANNIGVVAEAKIDGPSISLNTFITNVSTTLEGKRQAILAATQVEPCSVQKDANCVFQGNINFAPYTPCQ